jgi:hypothetical protein
VYFVEVLEVSFLLVFLECSFVGIFRFSVCWKFQMRFFCVGS